MRLTLVAGKVTDSVASGFLPAAARLGLDVTVLTDRPEDAYGDLRVRGCDVTDFREIIEHLDAPDAIFSNSDHLQAPAALAAAYLGLPGKDWRAATRAKNKALMRRHLRDGVFSSDAAHVPRDAPYPLVVKPREGVASEDVFLVGDASELAARLTGTRPMVAEQYLPGALHTLETLGDGRDLRILGSFRTRVSPPPYFIEERLDWAPPPPETSQILDLLGELGVGFGACHTEFVVHEGRATLIEVNYRVIGDHCDFLLCDLLGVDVFEQVLRVHLGEPLGEAFPSLAGAATVDYVIAERSGTLTQAPGHLETTVNGVRITYRPQRVPGDTISLTHTNRDYLGTIQAIGPAADQAIKEFRAARTWEIR